MYKTICWKVVIISTITHDYSKNVKITRKRNVWLTFTTRVSAFCFSYLFLFVFLCTHYSSSKYEAGQFASNKFSFLSYRTYFVLPSFKHMILSVTQCNRKYVQVVKSWRKPSKILFNHNWMILTVSTIRYGYE